MLKWLHNLFNRPDSLSDAIEESTAMRLTALDAIRAAAESNVRTIKADQQLFNAIIHQDEYVRLFDSLAYDGVWVYDGVLVGIKCVGEWPDQEKMVNNIKRCLDV